MSRYLVETTDGQVLTGLLVQRDRRRGRAQDKPTARRSASPAAEIERLAPQQKSLMPDLLLRDMTAQQVADLLEYLAGLK